MSKRRKSHTGSRSSRPARTALAEPAQRPAGPQAALNLRRTFLLGLAIAAAIVVAAGLYGWWSGYFSPRPDDSAAHPLAAEFVGRAVCSSCHAQQDKAWQGSHHQLAMQAANATTVLGDFANAKFRYFGVESTFFKHDGRFMVRTDGPDGKLADFEVKFTFGVTPLQQYLIEFPGGRFQALSIAWDARPKSAGGQRWFHLYPQEKIDHRDQLHWTGLYQNWNLQCAECHSTNLRKGYDPVANAYQTAFSEINVACEACHGAGSGHVRWAKKAKGPYSPQDHKGFAMLMRSRWNDAWKFPANDAKYAQRDKSADPAAMNACVACHSRRSTIAAGGHPGAALEDAHRLALLTPPLYHADGQQREEVYTWGSFRQSRMYQRGVTCMDCHEPHALTLRAPGNALCTRCHLATVFDSEKHHFHKDGTNGAQCVECHMPAQNYMVVDPRRDHSIRLPRPDLSISLGSPDACTQCHSDRKPAWAAAAMDRWYGRAWRERSHYGPMLHAGATQGAKPLPSLLALARDPATRAIVRATAATLAQPQMRSQLLPAAQSLLVDADPLVRIAAIGLLEPFEPATRLRAVSSLLDDPVRGVRLEAARILADVPEAQLAPEQRHARDSATKEYFGSLMLDADWPAANVNLGNLRMRQGRAAEAIAAYERALSLDARFAGAYVNLADAHRQQGNEAEGEKVLRRGLSVLPSSADLHHALGLLLVRQGDQTPALKELGEAARLSPDNARYAYVHAIGLHSAGRREEALVALRAADARHPFDLGILGALVSINHEAGNMKAALAYARRATEAAPEDPEVRRLVTGLAGTQ
ncbi:MAG: tetratricopeptide repeat protein [Betaproteobacteria bacterium]